MSGAGQEEDKKPADQSAHINLKVKGQVRYLPFPLLRPFFSVLLISDVMDFVVLCDLLLFRC